MEPDPFQKAWQADTEQTRVTIDTSRLIQEVQQSHAQLRHIVFWRDVREIAVSLMLLPLWFALGAALSLPWTWYLMVPALIWVGGFILYDRRRHRPVGTEAGAPLLDNLKQWLLQVDHQIWLLRNVFWWYLLPFSIAILAFFTQVAWNTSTNGIAFFLYILFSYSFLIVLYGWIYRLNQSAVKKQFEPQRMELQKLIASFEDGSSEHKTNELLRQTSMAVRRTQLNAYGATWDTIIPSWREALMIIAVTAVGASPGLFFPLKNFGPTFFQSVVGAVIAFEFALGYYWWRSTRTASPATAYRSESDTLSAEPRDPKLDAPNIDQPILDQHVGPRLPRTPALIVIVMTLFLSVMAIIALYVFLTSVRP